MKRIPLWAAGAYLLFSVTIYFGTLRGDAHNWWPAFLYPIVWPLGQLEHDVLSPALVHWLESNPENHSQAMWIAIDRVSGAFYIVAGTIWVWCIVTLIVRLVLAARRYRER